jgi:hypothetical protein
METRTTYRRRVAALAGGVLLGTSAVVAGASAGAHAAPPDNDRIRDARTITEIPTRVVQGTQQATSSANDGECVSGASVWYQFRPGTTSIARAVTAGSDFDTVLAVFRGPRTNRTLVACSDDSVGSASAVEVSFEAGARYWIAVSACCGPDGDGGRSVLSLYRPRVASMTVTRGPVQTGQVSGRLFVRGTIRCNTPSLAEVAVQASQRVGTMVARGSGVVFVPLCDGTARAWSVRVDSDTAVAFQEGVASVTVQGFSADGFDTAETEQTANVAVGSNPNRMLGR